MDVLARFTKQYECLPEVMAYDEAKQSQVREAPVRKQRTSLRQNQKHAVEQEAEEEQGVAGGIRLGNRKIAAVRNFLANGTKEALDILIKRVHKHE